MRMVKIVTHHEIPERAAELYAEEGVIAIGFDIGDPTGKNRDELKELFKEDWKASEAEAASYAGSLLRFRDNISVGDIVFAYAKRNTVSLVGKIISDHKYDERNKVGDPYGEILYPNQMKVEWWSKPRNFNRKNLPEEVSKKLALRGTIHIFEYDFDKLKEALDQIP